MKRERYNRVTETAKGYTIRWSDGSFQWIAKKTAAYYWCVCHGRKVLPLPKNLWVTIPEMGKITFAMWLEQVALTSNKIFIKNYFAIENNFCWIRERKLCA